MCVIVPILPHFVRNEENGQNETTLEAIKSYNNSRHSPLYHFLKLSAEHFQRGIQSSEGENHRLGFLLSLKAIIQLVANPVVVVVAQRKGCMFPLLAGSVNFIVCSIRN